MSLTEKESVCVTGAGGFLGSWLVNRLLSKDYIVHGTVREPGDVKYTHLKKLEKAQENLKLFKADLLDYESLRLAIAGCSGVFHVASPNPISAIQNPEVNLVEPAVKGTLNVLKSCLEANVKRVVVVSSIAAVSMNPRWPKGQTKDESCWSDKEYCRATNNWYHVGKTEAESEAFEFGKKTGLDVVSVCPVLLFGPLLTSTLNSSSLILLSLLKSGSLSWENKTGIIVDVRDVVEALILAYAKPEAQGRYICTAYTIKTKDLVMKLNSLYPNYDYPKSFIEVEEEEETLSSDKLRKLGWGCRPLEDILIDSVESYCKTGVLN